MGAADSDEREQTNRKSEQTALGRAVELARQVLRERGLSEVQIDAILSSKKPPRIESWLVAFLLIA